MPKPKTPAQARNSVSQPGRILLSKRYLCRFSVNLSGPNSQSARASPRIRPIRHPAKWIPDPETCFARQSCMIDECLRILMIQSNLRIWKIVQPKPSGRYRRIGDCLQLTRAIPVTYSNGIRTAVFYGQILCIVRVGSIDTVFPAWASRAFHSPSSALKYSRVRFRPSIR